MEQKHSIRKKSNITYFAVRFILRKYFKNAIRLNWSNLNYPNCLFNIFIAICKIILLITNIIQIFIICYDNKMLRLKYLRHGM